MRSRLWTINTWGAQHPVASPPGHWIKSQPLWLLLYSLCLSSPAASLWLLPCVWVHVHVCVVRLLSEQQEYIITQTKGAGLLFMNYQPSKANKGPYFHRKLHFHFSSIWLPEQEKNKKASPVATSQRDSFLLRSLVQLLWKGFFIAIFSEATSKMGYFVQ